MRSVRKLQAAISIPMFRLHPDDQTLTPPRGCAAGACCANSIPGDGLLIPCIPMTIILAERISSGLPGSYKRIRLRMIYPIFFSPIGHRGVSWLTNTLRLRSISRELPKITSWGACMVVQRLKWPSLITLAPGVDMAGIQDCNVAQEANAYVRVANLDWMPLQTTANPFRQRCSEGATAS